ncbi:magnesium chelatase subunit D [Dinoroseobacter sp. S375]|uniref:magnesium chelatase subunit D n=1 Tax=Dinoroseobacter sp. S375 TaxID=3415136 RepID=UPI003C7B7209
MIQTPHTDPVERWAQAATAVALLAIDPEGLGGLWMRARSGPVRDRLLAPLRDLLAAPRRLPPGIGDAQLFGGVDLAATLSAGRLVRAPGLLGAGPVALIAPMAERMTPGLAARLAQMLDTDQGHALIAMDEGAEEDERLAQCLADRLALHLDLEGLAQGDCPEPAYNRDEIAAARARLTQVRLPDTAITAMTVAAVRLGIDSLRAPLLALRVARAAAALDGRAEASEDDLITATELVLAPRATRFPSEETEDADPPETPPDSPPPESDAAPDEEQDSDDTPQRLPEEILLEAAKAVLPPDLLARIAAAKAPRTAKSGGGAGAAKKGNRRGRPLPSRPGRLDGQARIDLVATLRAAAPWQTIRRKLTPDAPQKVLVRAEDIRLRRFEEKSDRLLIFAVDASGSAALARLAEAKGAVELMLAEAYARRDHVALIAFRGTGAELLLPPTRSLVQTKRRLAALPGGGGTPLAAGLRASLDLAELSKGRGLSPTVALLTDGRANIALDGSPDRPSAAEDARAMARALRGQETPSVVIDMGKRPQPQLRELAGELAAPYIPMPRADSQRLSSAVTAALET